MWPFTRSADNRPLEEQLEGRRSRVRICATYIALAWIFVGSVGLAITLALVDMDESTIGHIRDVFFTVLPVATGIVTYWFASRRPKETGRSKDEDGRSRDTQDDR